MPQEKLSDLPDGVRNNVPKHAQEIYRAAFNSAEEEYGEESRAHRVAWGAVERKYEKNEDGEWVEKGTNGDLRWASTAVAKTGPQAGPL